jgi:hypothetical protein
MAKGAPPNSKTEAKTEVAPIRPVEGALVKAADGRTLVVTERGLGAVEAAATAGVSIAGLAALLGCSREGLRKARERQPELDEAIARGNASNEAELVGLLMQHARDGAFVPAIFLLKTKHGYREGDAPESKPSVVINLPDALAPAAYMDMLARRQRAVIEGDKPDAESGTTVAR